MPMAVEVTRRRFTADESQAMGRAGILREGDRVELIDGEVLAMSPIGAPHNGALNRLNRLFNQRVGDAATVQAGGAVRLDAYSEPQPDLVLLKARLDFYASALPGPSDILLAVEIAQSSLAYDRGIKADLYARRHVAEYWIVDLVHGVVIRHTDPVDGRYRHVAVVAHDQPFAPTLLPDCVVTTRDILG
jgi:Uma2 family endonuclease